MCLLQLLETVVVAVLPAKQLGLLLAQEALERRDQLEVTRWGDVVVLARLQEVLCAGLTNTGMEVNEALHHGGAHVDVELRLRVGVVLGGVEELHRNGAETLHGPFPEPVDRRAVHERGELEQAAAQRRADGREAQHDVDKQSAALNEEPEHTVAAGLAPELAHHLLQALEDLVDLVDGEQVRDLAGVKHSGDVLQEGLFGDLRVGDHEGDGADVARVHGAAQQELLHVLAEVNDAVAAGERDLEQLVLDEVRRELRAALPSTATNANKQRVAVWLAQNACDARHVLDHVVEDNEVHLALAALCVEVF
eukprot:PhM_4_TR18477/c0_g1_i1/m.21225